MSGVVYYLQHGEAGPIKIGFTAASVYTRIRQLQASAPDELKCLGVEVGDKELEARRHSQFSTIRHRGEWFRPEPALTSFLGRKFPGFSQEDLDRDHWRVELVDRVRSVRGRSQSSIDHFNEVARRQKISFNITQWLSKEVIPAPFPDAEIIALCEVLEAA